MQGLYRFTPKAGRIALEGTLLGWFKAQDLGELGESETSNRRVDLEFQRRMGVLLAMLVLIGFIDRWRKPDA